MCPNDSATCTSPLLPERPDLLLDSEVNSDVIFLVGPESEASRVPGHKRVLAAASPVFRTMFYGSLPVGPVVHIPDVERRAFDQLLRYIYGEKVKLQSVSTALTTLYAAHEYECEGLEKSCISYLSSHLHPSCVLDIYLDMRVYCKDSSRPQHNSNWKPSAPTLETVESDNSQVTSHSETFVVPVHTNTNHQEISNVSACYEALLHKCLQYIDIHADDVLQQEQLEELDKTQLCSIIQRETLGVSSEKVVFKALERWGNCKCKCNKWELSAEKRRDALGVELLFSVRYLLMTSEEFMSGPMKSNLLDKTETSVLLGHILKHSEIQKSPVYLEEVTSTLRRPRLKPLPMIRDADFDSTSLSRRSNIGASSTHSSLEELGASSRSGKKSKKIKKQRSKEERNVEERKLGFADYFFGCVACIFD